MSELAIIFICMSLSIVSIVQLRRLSKELLQIDEWLKKYEKSPNWLRFNGLTIYSWQVFWSATFGAFKQHRNQAIRRRARLLRISNIILILIVGTTFVYKLIKFNDAIHP
jgi:hypothetical protein